MALNTKKILEIFLLTLIIALTLANMAAVSGLLNL